MIDGARVVERTAIAGGDINEAHRVRLADGRTVFVKSNAAPPPGMYAAEAAGLDWLRGSPLRVPRVIAVDERWLALEWLDLGGRPDDAAFGRALAALHRMQAPCFGLDRPSFLATIEQRGTAATWPELYVEHRLRPMIELGIARGRIAPSQRAALDRLRPDHFGPPEPPSRLHGDLWWGNVSSCADGIPAIFDPAAYGGHREVDLAMLALFGGVSDRFLAAYNEVYPLAPDHRTRIPLYQAYPLATHAVLFGGHYADDLARTLWTI